MYKKAIPYFFIIIGSSIVSFGIYNIHVPSQIAEGGELGLELFINHFFNISPAITALVFDLTLFIIGIIVIGNKFAIKAVVGTLSYSISYYFFECFNPIFPNYGDDLINGCIIGAIFVGIGSGIVVKMGGASGGDDSLALILNKITKLPIFLCYFLFDVFVILISITYISKSNIIYSFITAIISSLIIGVIQKSTLKSKM